MGARDPTQTPYRLDYRIRRFDGEYRWHAFRGLPIRDDHGAVVKWIGTATDIDDERRSGAVRRVADRQSAEELTLLETVISTAPFGFGFVDRDFRIVRVNETMAAVNGSSAGEHIGQLIADLVPDLWPELEPLCRSVVDNNEAVMDDDRGRLPSGVDDPDGHDRHWRTSLYPVSLNDEVIGIGIVAVDVTEQTKAKLALEASRRRLAEAQRIAHVGSFELDLDSGEMTWSEEHYRILGLDPSLEPSTDLMVSLVHPDDLARVTDAWATATKAHVPFEAEYRIVRGDAEVRNSVPSRAESADDGTVVKLVGTIMDETERIESERERQEAETRFEIGFEQSAIGSVITDLAGIPIRVNPALCRLLGRPASELLGRRSTEYSPPDDVELAGAVRATGGRPRHLRGRAALPATRRHRVGVVSRHARARRVGEPAVLLHAAPGHHRTQADGAGARAPGAARLAHRPSEPHAAHRPAGARPRRLTAARRATRRDLRRHRSPQGGQRLAWVTPPATSCCATSAERIAGAIRPGDTVARFGGDEFVVVCDDVSARETEEIAVRVLAALSQPCVGPGEEMKTTASLGIAIADERATPESLLRDSDAAMYRAKERGRGRIELFDEALRSRDERRTATTSALHRARARRVHGPLPAHRRPLDGGDGERRGAAAVGAPRARPHQPRTSSFRWPRRPASSSRSARGCSSRRAGSWRMAAHRPAMTVAVNLSVRQLLDPAIDARVAVLLQSGARATGLCLELTESVFMEDVEYFGKALARLKRLGVRLAIDDFGTGYSSLSYLKRFPVDAVKVDRSFVDGLGTDPHDSALVAAIVAMAAALDLEVTAEGVETQASLRT